MVLGCGLGENQTPSFRGRHFWKATPAARWCRKNALMVRWLVVETFAEDVRAEIERRVSSIVQLEMEMELEDPGPAKGIRALC